MKKLFLFLCCSLMSWAVMAKDPKLDLDIIISSKVGGTQYLLYQELKPLLEEKGYRVNVVVPGNCVKSADAFLDSTAPSLLVVFNSYLALKECSSIRPGSDNWVANLTKSQLMICERPGFGFLSKVPSSEKIPVGSVNAYPPAILESLDRDISYVPYKTSGALARGFLAGDVNVIITNSLRASQLVADNKADCVLATGSQPHLGAPPAETVFPNWQHAGIYQLFAVLQRNVPAEQLKQLRADMNMILHDRRWLIFANRSGYDIDPEISYQEFKDSSKLWARN